MRTQAMESPYFFQLASECFLALVMQKFILLDDSLSAINIPLSWLSGKMSSLPFHLSYHSPDCNQHIQTYAFLTLWHLMLDINTIYYW